MDFMAHGRDVWKRSDAGQFHETRACRIFRSIFFRKASIGTRAKQNAYDHVVSDCFSGGPLCSLRSFCQANSFRDLYPAEFKTERGFLRDMERV